MAKHPKPYPYKVTTFPPEDDPGWFEADVWDCPCGVKKIAEDCPECPGCGCPQGPGPGEGYGPGDGTGNDGEGPGDGTGNGPGRCR